MKTQKVSISIKISSLLLVLAMLQGCKKSVGNGTVVGPGTGTVSATINGSNENFTVFTSEATVDPNGFNNKLYFGATNNTNEVQITILFFDKQIAAGTYKIEQDPSYPTPSIIYTKNVKDFSLDNPKINYLAIFSDQIPSVVTINSVTTTNVTGTFSGTLINSANQQIIVTNGKFTVNL